MSAPVAMIPYANMAPYRQLGAPRDCHFVTLVPKASVDALVSGQVTAAAVPVGGMCRLAGIIETVGHFGIAAKGASMSVLLFSRYPMEEMHAPKTLHLTPESASSVRLLYLLLGRRVGFNRLPHLAARGQAPDATLLIGDRALIKGVSDAAADAFPHVIDLSQEWFDLYGLPFVFARWVVRLDTPDSTKRAIADWLDTFKANESILVQRSVPEAARRLSLAHNAVERYFQAIRRCLDESDREGQRLFFQLIDQFGRDRLFEPQ
jgi:chorismate dehydratase